MSKARLKPSILVSLSTRIIGGVSYSRETLESERKGNRDFERWETRREIPDVEQYERAKVVRGKATNLVKRVCAVTPFGLVCPLGLEESALDAAIEAAEREVRAHNKACPGAQVGFYVCTGEIDDDKRTCRRIAEEIQTLLREVEAGIRGGSVESIRKAATQAREMARILDPEQGKRVTAAVASARRAARDIVRRIEKYGEPQSLVFLKEIEAQAARNLRQARIAFLESDPEETEGMEAEEPIIPDGPRGPGIAAARIAALEWGE